VELPALNLDLYSETCAVDTIKMYNSKYPYNRSPAEKWPASLEHHTVIMKPV